MRLTYKCVQYVFRLKNKVIWKLIWKLFNIKVPTILNVLLFIINSWHYQLLLVKIKKKNKVFIKKL